MVLHQPVETAPESMKSELAAWNNGAGIAIEPWVGCAGNFSLAVGYASVFWGSSCLRDTFFERASRKLLCGDLSNNKASIADRSNGI
jgi:hypothetical protein